jgi:hypothetical protein
MEDGGSRMAGEVAGKQVEVQSHRVPDGRRAGWKPAPRRDWRCEQVGVSSAPAAEKRAGAQGALSATFVV